MKQAVVIAAVVIGLLATSGASATAGALPAGGTFFDDDNSVHEPAIEAIAAAGITKGCGGSVGDLYCPDRPVTRGEMAAFLARALGLRGSPTDRFVDDDGSFFETDIERLAAAGITRGCRPDRFCPDRVLTRGEMAALLTRALGYEDRADGRFVDDDDSIFEADIERLAAAGVTKGCNPPDNDRFCPTAPVTRAQMASFLVRALGLDPIVPPERPTVTIAFTGDTLTHLPVTNQAGRNGPGSTFDFRPMFEPVRMLLSGADLTICHLEVPLSPDSSVLSGYPRFSGPAELASGLAWAGFDGCSTASNHSIDQGASGALATIDVLEQAGLDQSGMSRSQSDAEVVTTYDVEGFTIAHLSVTFSLNGLRLPADMPWLVEMIDEARILSLAAQARRDGADLVAVSIHCCTEYQTLPTSYQMALDRRLIDSEDIDLIVGHHAHVVQPIERRNGEFIIYGLGNFLSGQQWSNPTTDGVIVFVDFVPRGDRLVARSVRYTPTWVEGGSYRILPAAETIAGGVSSWLETELRASWSRTTSAVRQFGVDATPTARP